MSGWHPEMPERFRDQIVTGDARELAREIPDESVDLIFTDPIYSDHEAYVWLAQIAQRVLKPGGAVLVWSNGRWHRKNADWLEHSGLVYRWDFACVRTSGACPMDGHVIAKTNRLLWLDTTGQGKMVGYLADGWLSTIWSTPGKHNHQWTKNPVFMAHAVRAFTEDGATILDPFCGGGTVPVVCKMLGRHWVAFEIDPATAERARERVAATTPPLPGLDLPEQLTMEV